MMPLLDPRVINYALKVPYGYGQTYKTLSELEAILLVHYHPEYVRRLIAWLHSKGGKIGVGGHWRDDGTQPDKPGFAPEGKSFHQNQKYNDGFIGATAVDLVAPDGPDADFSHDGVKWTDVPIQGSAEAAKWGLHANVGTPGQAGSEPWHLQPIEIDGWDTWNANGCPCPRANYPLPIPTLTTPAPQESPVVYVFIQPQEPEFKQGVFTPDGHPVTAGYMEALRAAGAKVVVFSQAPHEHWKEATLHRMGEAARRLYGDTTAA